MDSQAKKTVCADEAGTPPGSTTKLAWKDVDVVPVGSGSVNISRDLAHQSNHTSGLRPDAGGASAGSRLFQRAMRLHNYLLVDGFIEREVDRLLAEHYRPGQTFLEVGCGDMTISRFLPKETWYNAFDLSLSELNLLRLFRARERVNVAMASAKRIPLDSGVVDCLVSTECLEHIPGVESAVREMRRVCRTGGKAIITIPNNFGTKYKVKGPHPEHVNDWTFAGFTEFMAACGFRKLDGFMKGYWLPIPTRVTRVSYQIPRSSAAEPENTNFFYVFEAV
jgi:SAM-dependent methyltransferase